MVGRYCLDHGGWWWLFFMVVMGGGGWWWVVARFIHPGKKVLLTEVYKHLNSLYLQMIN